MARYLDIENWHRRPVFQFFKNYDNPFFNLCAQVEVTALLNLTRSVEGISFTLAYHFLSLKAVNELEPFRYRLRGERVLVYDRVHAGTTVLLDNERFIFCYFDYEEDFEQFQVGARRAIEQARASDNLSDMGEAQRDDLIHHSVIPWVSFTSISHARRWGNVDSIPKITFGKPVEANGVSRMPVSVEVHHALMDGLDVGRYFELVGDYFSNPSMALGVVSGEL